jgi:hypothetical protein
MRAKLEAYRRYRASGEEQGVQDGVFPLVVTVTSSPERQAMLLALLTYLPTEDWQLFKIGQLADAARLLMGARHEVADQLAEATTSGGLAPPLPILRRCTKVQLPRKLDNLYRASFVDQRSSM